MPTDSHDPTRPSDVPGRPLSRRQLLVLTAATAAALASGCGDQEEAKKTEDPGGKSSTHPATAPAGGDADESVFDVGLLDDYDTAQVYADHREDGFFVIRRDGEVVALSSVCTHKGCLVSPQSDGSYKCFCHGSLFSPEGKVVKGPAKRDLPRLAVKLDDRRHVLINTDRKLENPA